MPKQSSPDKAQHDIKKPPTVRPDLQDMILSADFFRVQWMYKVSSEASGSSRSANNCCYFDLQMMLTS